MKLKATPSLPLNIGKSYANTITEIGDTEFTENNCMMTVKVFVSLTACDAKKASCFVEETLNEKQENITHIWYEIPEGEDAATIGAKHDERTLQVLAGRYGIKPEDFTPI